MKNCKVDCITDQMCRALQAIAFDNQVNWWQTKDHHIKRDNRYLFYCDGSNDNGFGGEREGLSHSADWSIFNTSDYHEVTIEEFVKMLEEHNKPKMTYLCGCKITLHPNGAIQINNSSITQAENVENFIKEYQKFNNLS